MRQSHREAYGDKRHYQLIRVVPFRGKGRPIMGNLGDNESGREWRPLLRKR
jgi:hypothetical protein